jgi:hypothetical protein
VSGLSEQRRQLYGGRAGIEDLFETDRSFSRLWSNDCMP